MVVMVWLLVFQFVGAAFCLLQLLCIFHFSHVIIFQLEIQLVCEMCESTFSKLIASQLLFKHQRTHTNFLSFQKQQQQQHQH